MKEKLLNLNSTSLIYSSNLKSSNSFETNLLKKKKNHHIPTYNCTFSELEDLFNRVSKHLML